MKACIENNCRKLFVPTLTLGLTLFPIFDRKRRRLYCTRLFPLVIAHKTLLIFLLLSTTLCRSLPVLGSPVGTLGFSPQPTVSEIFNARGFDEPLLPIGGEPRAEENKALADSLADYAYRTNLDDFSSLTAFLARFPNSAYSGSLLLHLGTEYYNYGHYSKALDAWEQAWQDLKKTDDPKGKSQADRSLGELARMYSKLGRMGELSNLLASVANRSLTGPGTQLIHSAQEAIWLMQNRPGICFRCGPMALDSILSNKDPAKTANPLILESQSTTNGFSLSQVATLSGKLGMNYQMAFRSPGAPWVVPAVIHWKVGHYAALLQRNGNQFLVKDHTFQSSLRMSGSGLDQECSGYFLIPSGPMPSGWRTVTETEAQGVWGRGTVSGRNSNQTGPGGTDTGGGGGGGGPGAGPGAGPPPGTPPPPPQPCENNGVGMTTYTMHTMLASLSLYDTPAGYKPPIGPWVEFIAYYNQNEANQPATFYYSNLGSDWDCNWIAYITDNPNSPGVGVTCYGPGGGTMTFTGFNSTNQTFAPELMTQAILVQTSSSGYELQFPSGAKKEFKLSDGSTGSSRRIFMTQVIDPAGNTVTLSYDSSLRITNITDAIDQNTILYYTNASYPFAITAVKDPFGRTAHFQYNSFGLLSQITDMIGITSQYFYDANGFVTNLTTPYGTTVFSTGTTNGTTWLQATDPLGESELAEAPLATTSMESDPPATVPTNMLVAPTNNFLEDRDTYFWGKQAYAAGAGNPLQATVYHFLHDVDASLESGVLESFKEPLENRVWYNYAGTLSPVVLGPETINKPIAIGRVLDDGSSQTSYYQYNALGLVTNSTDPLGRNFTYVYATNNVDLLQVIMTSNGKNELQASITYNSQHRPLTITDTAGQTTTNTYNSRGQILSSADPLGETINFGYDTNGYLLSITGPLQTTNDITSFTYDGLGRVRTATDTEGYTLTYAYDAMDRVTNITHPDGTSEQFVYTLLDLTASKDRLGRWTTNAYNADRQLIQTQDPLGRIIQYQYCDCGALEAIFDPAGNVTWWDHDIESRVTGKHYADGSKITYAYENTIKRLHSSVDEKGQKTFYQYYEDNNLESVSYPNAIVTTPTVSYFYDTNYNRVVTMLDGIGTTVYTYNPVSSPPANGAGKLSSVSGPLPNSTVTYQYDQLDRLVNRAINGVAQAFTFNVLGCPIVVTNALGIFQYTYVDATPRLASEAYPNGQTNLYTYYKNLGDQRLLRIQNMYPNGSLISGFGYAYNAVGQITAWTNQWDTLPNRVWFSGNDAADQLTNVAVTGGSGPVTSYSYTYDLAGNRVLAGTNGSQNQYYYNALNQIVGSSVTLTNIGYEWDAENRLTAINRGINRSEFYYDGLGRRVEIIEKTNGVVATNNWYLWCGNAICEIRDSSGATTLRRVYPQGETLVGADGFTNYFYTKDHLGSIREALDTNGVLATRYDYDPFGSRSIIQDTLKTTFAYTGDFIHMPSAIYLTKYRSLNSFIGRWLTRDPAQERVGLNLYTYVSNDPVNRWDALGLEGCSSENSPNNPAPPAPPNSTIPSPPPPSLNDLANDLKNNVPLITQIINYLNGKNDSPTSNLLGPILDNLPGTINNVTSPQHNGQFGNDPETGLPPREF
jgi:RHS repeat-associated protein